eukprot:INCI16198.4.p1 GENE.INCI16198.4~~INCI16198.4.p1  ORF type:complete len:950 (-),score=102.77 INCI16198.4:24-2873(-)
MKPAPALARVRTQLVTMPALSSTVLSVLTCALLANVLLADINDVYVTAPIVAARRLQSGSYSDPGTLNTTTTTTTTTTTGECGLCGGISCDRQVEQQGLTCEYMEKDLGCDCSWCDCPTDCFDVFDVENGDGSCAYYAENNFCKSYFCPDCLYSGQCDFSCSFGNCDTTTTTTKITTDIDTTTSYVSTTESLSYVLIYSNVKETCNNVFKIDSVCSAASSCTLRECWEYCEADDACTHAQYRASAICVLFNGCSITKSTVTLGDTWEKVLDTGSPAASTTPAGPGAAPTPCSVLQQMDPTIECAPSPSPFGSIPSPASPAPGYESCMTEDETLGTLTHCGLSLADCSCTLDCTVYNDCCQDFYAAGCDKTSTTTTTTRGPCPPGKFDEVIRSRQDGLWVFVDVCTNCSAGFYQIRRDETECLACAAGTTAALPGATSCDYCTPGYFANVTGSISCAACGVGFFQANSRQSICKPCAAGRYQIEKGTSTCIECSRGQTQSSTQQSECELCSPGRYMNNTGSDAPCSECPYGQFQNSSGQALCTQCKPGQFQDFRGSDSSCLQCARGEYVDVHGASACKECSSGTFALEKGQSECKTTTTTTTTTLDTTTTTVVCLPGQYADPDLKFQACSDCPPGQFQVFGGATSCENCTAGNFQSEAGTTVCHGCPVGKFSLSGFSECTKCEFGRFQNVTNQTLCRNCDIGEYQNLRGKTQCKLCKAGFYGSALGQDACTPCAPGYFIEGKGSLGCTKCDPGFFASENATSVCSGCAPGQFVDGSGAMSCRDCLSGKYTADSGLTACEQCPDGRFGDERGQSYCYTTTTTTTTTTYNATKPDGWESSFCEYEVFSKCADTDTLELTHYQCEMETLQERQVSYVYFQLANGKHQCQLFDGFCKDYTATVKKWTVYGICTTTTTTTTSTSTTTTTTSTSTTTSTTIPKKYDDSSLRRQSWL